jgi:hypothetical protein
MMIVAATASAQDVGCAVQLPATVARRFERHANTFTLGTNKDWAIMKVHDTRFDT